jgi:YcxB-like protein
VSLLLGIALVKLLVVAFNPIGLVNWGHDKATYPPNLLRSRSLRLDRLATMSHEATLIYSTALLRQAVFGFWWRSVGVGFFVALFIAAIGIVVLVALGQASWIIGVLATVLAAGIGFAAAVYIVHYRNSLRKFRQMDTPRSTFRAEESSFTMSSDIGTTTLQWSTVKELWQFQSVWLLLYSKSQFTTLPIECLSPETQAYIVQRVRESGGKVDG